MTNSAQSRFIERELCKSKWEQREIAVKTLGKSEGSKGQIKRNILKEAINKLELKNAMKKYVLYTESAYKNMGDYLCKLPSFLGIP